MRHPILATAAAFAAAVALALAPMTAASAAVVTADGELVAGGPTFNRPSSCTTLSGAGTAVYDASAMFTVDVAGTYVIDMVAENLTNNDAIFVLYQGAFDPSAPLTNCIAYNDDIATVGVPRLTLPLVTGVQYTLVTTTFSNGVSGTFTNSFDGPGTVTFVAGVPTVTVDQASGQLDPTSAPSAAFDVVFASPVTGLTASDFVVGGTAGATAVSLSGSGANYVATVTGPTVAGTITLSLPAGAAISGEGYFNPASISTDNSVEFLPTRPTVSVGLASGQAEPSTSPTLAFDIVFAEPVTGFDATDIVLSGTAPGATAVLAGAGAAYVLTVTVTAPGTVVVSVPAGVATSTAWSAPNLASTPTTATYQAPRPATAALPPTGASQAPIGLPIALLVIGGILAVGAAARSRFVTGRTR